MVGWRGGPDHQDPLGTPYKPSALRAYEQALRTKVVPELGHLRLSAIARAAIQGVIDSLVASGRSPSTVRNAILPLRAIYRRALTRADVLVNPTLGLALPAQRGRRDRIAAPSEAAKLLGALTPADRAVWATALYAGLRRGEIRGLRVQDVDFEVVYVPAMTPARAFLGVARALIGVGSWVAPDLTVLLFGIDPARSDRFVGRLFGARELALAGALLAAPASAVAPVAALGAAVDAADAVAGFDERRRGNLSAQATVLGPVGALVFVALGVLVASRASVADAA